MSYDQFRPDPQAQDTAQFSRRNLFRIAGGIAGSLLASCGSTSEHSDSGAPITTATPTTTNKAPGSKNPLSFEGMPDGPIPNVWGYDLDPLTPTWNKEAQTYDDKHAEIKDGLLVISGIKTATGIESSRINTLDKFSFKNGTLTARMMLPEGVGSWPAFWLLPIEKDTPKILKKYGLPNNPQEDDFYYVWGGEIDIMEATGVDGPINQPTAHTYRTRSEGASGKSFITKPIKDAYTAFHDYGLRKTPGKLEFMLDGKVINTLERRPGDSLAEWPYDDYEYYCVLNLAFGGDWAGRNGIDNSKSPWQLKVASIQFEAAA